MILQPNPAAVTHSTIIRLGYTENTMMRIRHLPNSKSKRSATIEEKTQQQKNLSHFYIQVENDLIHGFKIVSACVWNFLCDHIHKWIFFCLHHQFCISAFERWYSTRPQSQPPTDIRSKKKKLKEFLQNRKFQSIENVPIHMWSDKRCSRLSSTSKCLGQHIYPIWFVTY